MELPLRGGCLCGAIRYECDAAPLTVVCCHCRDCQRVGAPFSVGASFPAAALRVVAGEPRVHAVASHSGQRAFREFCATCGTQLFARAERFAGVRVVKVPTFDEPGALRPVAHVWTRSALPWLDLDDGLPRFDTLPDLPRDAGGAQRGK